MRQLWEDLAQKLGVADGALRQRCYCVYGEDLVIVEGQKSVLSVTATEICFAYGGGTLKVCGQNLKIKSLSAGLAAVEGKISAVERR